MQPRLRIIICSLLLMFFCSSVYAADLNFPYARFRIKYPPSEDPFPGLGNYYSTLSKGIKTTLWNPASLGKIKLAETSLSIIKPSSSYTYNRTTNVAEMGGDIEFSEGSTAGRYGIFFRTPDNIGSGLNTQEISVLSTANYATEGTGMNFSSALKVNDWFSIGFTTNNPLAADMNLAGQVPTTAKTALDFYDSNFDQMQITNSGKLNYTYSSNGNITTYESVEPLWSGFISQEVTIPLTSLAEIRNNLDFQSPYTSTLAGNFGDLYIGGSMIPISANANFNNTTRFVVNSDATDQFIYVPDFDSDNQSEIASWINDRDQYGSSDGYKRKQIVIPQGEVVGNATYRGFYSASTTRFDLGAMYDFGDWLTIGFALENATSSSLNFKGNNIAAHITYREVNTAEAGNLNDLFQPGGTSSIDLISDRWVNTTEVDGTKLMLEPEKNYDLPKRMRYGFALKKPWLIAVDWENNQTPIKIKYSENDQAKEIEISNINLIRVGAETRVFALPWWWRMGLTLISKPTVTGLDSDQQSSLDDTFQFGFLPLKFDLGTDIDLWSYLLGLSFGFNGQGILNSMQMDSTNLDLSKIVYLNTYVNKDAWQINYLMQADPFATAAAYGSKTVPAGQERQFEVSDLKFVQTLGVTYQF